MNHKDMGEIVLRMSRKRKGGTGATSIASSHAAPSVPASSGESGARALPPPRTTRASSPTKKLPVKRARVEPSIVGGTGTPLSADVLAARIQEAAGELYEQRTLPPPLPPGMAVAYSAPSRHFCLSVVENNYCASKRGGVRCLFVLNVVFAVIFGLLSLFLGSSLLTLGSRCSIPLFWCYEITTWGLVALYGGAAFFLRRKAASVLDEGNYCGRNLGLEMLESSPPVNPDMQGRVNEGFRAWMGSSLLSSDDEEDVNDYSSLEEAHPIQINSSRQRG